MLLALKSALITSRTLGNDTAVRLPSDLLLIQFCLEGLGASCDEEWFASVNDRLALPGRRRARRAKAST